MAKGETYWVIKDDGDYLCRRNSGWSWSIDPGLAHHFATLKDAHAEIDECPVTARVFRRKKRAPRLILTGKAARLVREWREKPTGVRAGTMNACWMASIAVRDMLAALASEEVRDG